ncbi:hypothetical protein PM8797T_11751 [Gimesia maris DSM 8797]|nr:hypothetical protein PM8797T_11751 [Gimesia maris DSM 8797]
MHVQNSTLSGNSTLLLGGGIYSRFDRYTGSVEQHDRVE